MISFRRTHGPNDEQPQWPTQEDNRALKGTDLFKADSVVFTLACIEPRRNRYPDAHNENSFQIQ